MREPPLYVLPIEREDELLVVRDPPLYVLPLERLTLLLVDREGLTLLLVDRDGLTLLLVEREGLTLLLVERVVLAVVRVVPAVLVVREGLTLLLVDRVALAVVVEREGLADVRVVLPNVLRLALAALVVLPVLRSGAATAALRERTPLLELRISRALVKPVLRLVNERSG